MAMNTSQRHWLARGLQEMGNMVAAGSILGAFLKDEVSTIKAVAAIILVALLYFIGHQVLPRHIPQKHKKEN